MMTVSEVESRLRDKPFRPFRVFTSGGQSYEVCHPDMVIIGQRTILVGIPFTDQPQYSDQSTRISILHITELQDI